jgi:hypothetical protein
MGAGLAQVCAFWLGEDLGPLGAACLASFVAQGHPVTLHAYAAPRGVPAGVTLADAAKILPAERIVRHFPTGSPALFSDLFRYHLMRREAGIWVDCDVFCLRPITDEGGYVLGREDDTIIGNGVLRLPAYSPMLDRLIALFDASDPMPPWLAPEALARLRRALRAGKHFDVTHLPWGAAGPKAITYLANEFGLAGLAQPPEVFAPLGWRDAHRLLSAEYDLATVVTPATLTIHLWHERLRQAVAGGAAIEEGSPLHRLWTTGSPFARTRVR